jgi:hypothetical protein
MLLVTVAIQRNIPQHDTLPNQLTKAMEKSFAPENTSYPVTQ